MYMNFLASLTVLGVRGTRCLSCRNSFLFRFFYSEETDVVKMVAWMQVYNAYLA